MTTNNIYHLIKDENNYLKSYEKLRSMDYPNDILELVYLVDFNIDINNLVIEKQEYEKRKYQRKLRVQALKKYYGKCVISGENKHKLLEVAHIKAVKDCENINEKKDINNTLLLWLDLHKYFDHYTFTINPQTLKIEVNTNNEDNLWLMKYSGMKLNCVNPEMVKYIEHHYLTCKKIWK